MEWVLSFTTSPAPPITATIAPPRSKSGLVPNTTPSLRNSTSPVGIVPAVDEPTVAVKTGGAVVSDGLRDDVRVVLVAAGAAGANRTELSVLVEATLGFPPASTAAPAGMEATTVPVPVMPLTMTVRLEPGPRSICALRAPPTVDPANETSLASKPVTGSLKVTVNSIGEPEVG